MPNGLGPLAEVVPRYLVMIGQFAGGLGEVKAFEPRDAAPLEPPQVEERKVFSVIRASRQIS